MNYQEMFEYKPFAFSQTREVYEKRFGLKPYRLHIDSQTQNIIDAATLYAEDQLCSQYELDNPCTASAVAKSISKHTKRGKLSQSRILMGGDFILGPLLQNASCIERAVLGRELLDNFSVQNEIAFTRLLGIPFHHYLYVPNTDEVIDGVVPLMLRTHEFKNGYFPSQDMYFDCVQRINAMMTTKNLIKQLRSI